jgi:hypothetical protein
MSPIFVLSTTGARCPRSHPGTARRWLTLEEAAVLRRSRSPPFGSEPLPARPVKPLRVKIDPGSQTTSLAVETGTGERTQWNRTTRRLPKTYRVDAACVGASSPAVLRALGVVPLVVTATGWQSRQMCLLDDRGFPRMRARQQSRVQGFRTGDLVRALVPTGTRAGTSVGRVAVRASGRFQVTTSRGTIQGIASTHCRALQHRDGYSYAKGGGDSSRSRSRGRVSVV